MSLPDWAASFRARLAPHVNQLRRGLESLAERVRQSLASTLGRTVADAVTEAVEAALAAPTDQLGYYPPAGHNNSREWWRDREEPQWGGRQGDYDPYGRPYADAPYGRDPSDDDAVQEPAGTPEAQEEPPNGRLARSLAAGCRAAGWWLERHPGRFSLVMAAGVGVAAGVAAFLSGSAFIGVTGAAASALAVLALTDTLRCAAAALGAPP